MKTAQQKFDISMFFRAVTSFEFVNTSFHVLAANKGNRGKQHDGASLRTLKNSFSVKLLDILFKLRTSILNSTICVGETGFDNCI